MFTDLQRREIFHFIFLERFLKITDSNLYSLKGGVNLRFYFNSPRYSEDMDLDVFGGSVETLKKNGYKILEDISFLKQLNSYGISELILGDKNKAKHTETVQKFKLNLVTNSGVNLPTKVEFSRRKSEKDFVKIEKMDDKIAKSYNRVPYFCSHYPADSAIIQKINALAYRTETQARDLFDLELLISNQIFNQRFIFEKINSDLIFQVIEKAESIHFDQYRGQVLEFISEEKLDSYSKKKNWEKLRLKVISYLNEFI